MERFPNIVYHRAATRIGIYEAWNMGVKMARGRYLTNTNLDDLRRHDSLERQLELFEKFPFVDIAYQDFFYSFDGHATFDSSASLGFKSQLPIVTAYNLMQSNSPHNAPMWRRSLHDEIGMFDESFKSAGDYDFWMRCVERGKIFFKINDPHVVYFVNPEGLSTQAGTKGIDEAGRVTFMHGGSLLSDALLNSDAGFIDQLQRVSGLQFEIDEEMRELENWRYRAAQQALRQCSAASRAVTKQLAQAPS